MPGTKLTTKSARRAKGASSSFEVGKDLFGRYGSGQRDTARRHREFYREQLGMRKLKRNVGLEILEGIREIKRGQHGRVMKVSSVSSARKKSGSRKS